MIFENFRVIFIFMVFFNKYLLSSEDLKVRFMKIIKSFNVGDFIYVLRIYKDVYFSN